VKKNSSKNFAKSFLREDSGINKKSGEGFIVLQRVCTNRCFYGVTFATVIDGAVTLPVFWAAGVLVAVATGAVPVLT
jgi:hypothetical protein